MTAFALDFLLALLALIMLGCFVAIGEDILQTAMHGPRWHRRFVAAGVFLLSIAGMSWVFREKMRRATRPPFVYCYLFYAIPARPELESLPKRLLLLDRLVDQGTLPPAALRKVVAAIESDLGALPEGESGKIVDRNAAEALLARIKSRIGDHA